MVATTPSRNFNHPKYLIPVAIAATSITVADSLTDGGNLLVSTAASCWSTVLHSGTAVDTAFTADTWKTIVSTSSAGELSYIIGPTSSGSDTTTFGVTINGGAEVEIPVTVTSGQRALLYSAAGGADAFTSANRWGLEIGRIAADAKTFTGTSATLLPSVIATRHLGAPLLEWSVSFQLRIKHSADITATANQGRQSGCSYRLYSG